MSRETYLPILFDLFRHYGYDGVTLSKISQATKLGKASLYHHFPGGKAEMLSATLTYTECWFEENILQSLQGEDKTTKEQITEEQTTKERKEERTAQNKTTQAQAATQLQIMCDRLIDLYEAGAQPCLLATLTTGTAHPQFQAVVKARIERFIQAIATLLINSGISQSVAQQRAEDALITLQGALIVSRGLRNPSIFIRAIASLPQKLCAQSPL